MHKPLGKFSVVLLGVGHTNAHVLRMWKMQPVENAQLICVSDFPIATYSGMLPAVVAGQSTISDMQIDLVRLTQSAGARLVLGKVNGLDHEKRELLFADRPPLSFDFLSIGIGSRPTFSGVQVDDDAPLIAVKPMQTFLSRLQDMIASSRKEAPEIVIVGGGVGSIEIAFCLWQRYYGAPKHANEFGSSRPKIKLVTGASSIGTGLLASTSNRIKKALQERGIELITGQRVARVKQQELVLKDGNTITSDLVIWTTSAVGAPLLSQLGLENDERGFLMTRQDLQTTKLDGVFAVGDTGTIVGSNISKAGVFAVRQGPVLDRNIRSLVSGKTKLEDYKPQTGFLKLINLGNDRAIAEYAGRSFQGGWCWRLKDHIDVKFMQMYQDYTPMAMSYDPPVDAEVMKCLGCGGKVGSQLLSDVLGELDMPNHEYVIIGLEHPDDAAVVRTHDNRVTVTTDFFAAPFDDPYLVGRIATLNSISDCFVMGAQPTTALAIVQLPEGHPRAQRQVMRELMSGSVEELKKAGATIVGGHTIEGPRTIFGFTVLARQPEEAKTKGMLQAGDLLINTKPLGTGVLLAALMQSQLEAPFYRPLLDSMLLSNQVALKLLDEFPITAITDVTGFGLAGHLAEMLMASGVKARIDVSTVSILPGAEELLRQGVESTLAPDNRSVAGKIVIRGQSIHDEPTRILVDPQTGGGLVFGVSPKRSDDVMQFLANHGFSDSSVIGEVTAASNEPSLEIV